MINPLLLTNLQSFLSREHEIKFPGAKERQEDYDTLAEELKSLLPDWFQELLLNYPLTGLVIDINGNTEDELSIEFAGFENVQDEFYDLYPGCAIGRLGYLCIGEDPTGSGDPYFINIKDGDNPPVYQVYHDAGDVGEEIIEHGCVKIANKLSDLFSR